MNGGSGLSRKELHFAHTIGDASRRDHPSTDSGVIEEDYISDLAHSGLSPEEVDRAAFAFRKSLLPLEQRGIPVGRVALDEPPLQ